jgi:hypothetical protein
MAHSLSLTTRVSAVSGLAWAAIAWLVGHQIFGPVIWGGVIVAPFIGIVVGRVPPPRHMALWKQLAVSLRDLYLAAVLFAISMQILAAIFSPHDAGGPIVLAVLWGLTFGGVTLLLWPLSFFNHRLVWEISGAWLSPPPAVPLTAGRRRAIRITVWCLVLAAFLWL